MVNLSWCYFNRKTLSLDEDGTAPISNFKLFNLHQQSLGGLFKQDRGRMALMVRDMAEILYQFVVNQRISQIKFKILQLFQ